MFNPVSFASCSRMCLVGLGVAANAAFSVSSCFALIVVRGPRLFVPGVFSSFPDPVRLVVVVPAEAVPLLLDPMLEGGEDAHRESAPVPPEIPCPESEREEDADRGEDLEESASRDPAPPPPPPVPPFDPGNRLWW